MDQELKERLEAIESKLNEEKKGFWDKIQILTPILIPVILALAGWYFQAEYNETQMVLQKQKDSVQFAMQQINDSNQRQIAYMNATVGQSALIKDFIPLINSKDPLERNIAFEAILYAAPAPATRIQELRLTFGNEEDKSRAKDALDLKRADLINKLFSFSKNDRLIAANEIILNWTDDSQIVEGLKIKAIGCLNGTDEISDCNNGAYNALIVLNNFKIATLKKFEQDILDLIKKIPPSQKSTIRQGEKLISKMNTSN